MKNQFTDCSSETMDYNSLVQRAEDLQIIVHKYTQKIATHNRESELLCNKIDNLPARRDTVAARREYMKALRIAEKQHDELLDIYFDVCEQFNKTLEQFDRVEKTQAEKDEEKEFI